MARSRHEEISSSKHSSSFLDSVRSAAGRIRDAVLHRTENDPREQPKDVSGTGDSGERPGRDANQRIAEPRRRTLQSDVGVIDEIIPRQMRGHAPFDEARDVDRTQEGFEETGPSRWRDEDRLTNRSGDPRIGTHGRKYEP